MSPRKPNYYGSLAEYKESIADDIVGGIRNIVSPWLGTPPGEYASVTNAKTYIREQTKVVDDYVFGGMGQAYMKGPAALAKQAAINAAALGTGYVAGKAIQTAARAVAKTGVVPRAINKLTGKELIIHGSSAKNLPFIDPRVAPAHPGAGSRVFAGRPNVPPGAMHVYSPEDVTRMIHHYVGERSMQAQQLANPTKVITEYSGSAYVATVPKKVLEGTGYFVKSPVRARVVAEVPISGKTALSSSLNQAKDIEKITNAYIRAGGKFPKQPNIKNIKSTIAKNKTRS